MLFSPGVVDGELTALRPGAASRWSRGHEERRNAMSANRGGVGVGTQGGPAGQQSCRWEAVRARFAVSLAGLALLLFLAAAARAARSSYSAGYTGDVNGNVTGLHYLKNRT